ncbi:ABC transporter substrate-binding protein [Streptomyces sp. NPDC047009]|uniref:ABC transporter substrate-binding protein n=1 Tax=Streptomyces sp. NPDC047009 TaxID=3154496 RepID=UPI0033CE9DC6
MDAKQHPLHGRRGLRVASMVLVGGLAVGACAGQGAAQSSGGTSEHGGKITLKFWNGLTGGDKATLDKLVGEFNASHKDIKVESNPMPWDVFYQKLLTSVGSGTGPDIVAMDSGQMPKYAHSGVLQPVDDFYSAPSSGSDKLVKYAVQASKFGGKNYGVPLETAPMLLYWNKTLFQKAGLDPNKPPTTMAQFEQYAAKLTKDTNHDGKPDQYALAMADHETAPAFPVVLWADGGGVVSQDGKKAMLDDPATVSAVEHWADLYRNKKVSPIGINGGDADKLFQTQKVAMEIVGPWDTSTFTQAGVNYGVSMPFAGSQARTTAAIVTSLALTSSNPAAKKAAYTFFSYWNSKQSQLTLAKGTGFPANRTDVTASDLKGYPYPAAFGAPQVLNSSQPFLPGLANGPVIQDQIFYPALQRILSGKGSVASVLKQANADVTKQLEQTN